MTLTLTDTAEFRLRTFIRTSSAASAPLRGIRLSVKNGGCSGYEYGLGVVKAPKEGDITVQEGALNVYVDAQSAALLDGVIVDYIDSLLESGFKFTNPNATDTCSCGKSFQAGTCTPAAASCT